MTTENDYYEEDEGVHFDPTEQEVINSYLIPKLRGEPTGDFVVMKDVYAKEPWLLDHTNHSFLQEDEWYYFTTKTQISKEKIGCGKYAKRKIIVDGIERGHWNANGKKYIIDEDTGLVIGERQNLTYHSASKNKKRKRGGGSFSIDVPRNESWIMDEFRLPSLKENDKFQELVVCKIHKKKWSKEKENYHHEEDTSEELVPRKIHKKRNYKKKKEKDHHEEASTSTYHYQHDESSSSCWEQQQKEKDHHEEEASTSTNHYQHDDSPSSCWEQQQKEKDEEVEAVEITREIEGEAKWLDDWIEELMGRVKASDPNLLSIF